MLTLILGPNDSGKSSFAESLVARTTGRRVYLATMEAQTEENHRRIEKHRRQRAGLDFVTMEEPLRVADLPIRAGDVVLLEDVSNLLGNNIFQAGRDDGAVLQDILTLADRCRHLFLVTIGGLDPTEFTGETADYIRAMDRLNRALAQAADVVIEMEAGRPLARKGDWHGVL